MQLADFVARYPGARLAGPEDNARLLAFFEQTPMQTSAMAVQYRRSPDFFRLLRFQGERVHVFIGVDAKDDVRAVGTVTLRPGWLHGQPTVVGYLGDLRIGFDRRMAARWRAFYGALMTHASTIDELADCGCWFTAILDENVHARHSLERSRTGAPAYVTLAPFTMRNVVARLPFSRPHGSPACKVTSACTGDAARLGSFFEDENTRLPLGFRGEFARRLQHWDGLSVSDFVIAEDDGGIAACMAPWSPSAAKETVVMRMPTTLRILGGLASALPGRRIRIPRAGEPLRAAYLTHLTFAYRLAPMARGPVFRAMLDHLFDRWQHTNWHCAAFPDFAEWGLGSALGGYLQQTVPITVYGVVPPGDRGESVVAMRRVGPPAFEMAIV